MTDTSETRGARGPGQEAIWEYFQNEAPESFRTSRGRLLYLARFVSRGERVLNIGAGDGTLEEAALRRGALAHALDPSPATIEALRRRLGLGERARVGYGQAIPFPDRSFDAVVLSEVLEHLEEPTLRKTLAEAARVLAPAGRLIGTVPARENLAEQAVVCPHCGGRFHRWGHVQAFDPRRIRNLLSADFESVTTRERPFVTWATLNWKGKLQAAARLLLRAFGVHGRQETLVFIARRPCA